MRFVGSPKDVCGVAVAAMICNCSYRQAMNVAPDPFPTGGVTASELQHMCLLLGRPIELVAPERTWHLNEAPRPPGVVGALIKKQYAKVGHWIGIEGNWIFDHALSGRVKLSRYDSRSWLLMFWIT